MDNGMITIQRQGQTRSIPRVQQPVRQAQRLPEVGPADTSANIYHPSTSQIQLNTTYQDRAWGFDIATKRLSMAFCVAGFLIAIWGYQAPVVSMMTLASVAVGFFLAWIVGWAIHVFVSPDGALMLNSLYGFLVVRQEQKNRHVRYMSDTKLR